MSRSMKFIRGSLACGLLSAAAHVIAAAGGLDSVTVMALGPVDGRAVVSVADGKMQVLKVGQTVPGTNAVVTQVLPDKLVVEETVVRPDEPAVKQTIWIYKPGKAGEKSRIQRLDRQGPRAPVMERPVLGTAE